ncbi:helix-turn-helix domain-containing protein [Oleidesulfovibrio sp.]|uniref:helix-turn-helix domain-containing protein n=1 Tax=Oleidesulfovibrio sp. TaxID=2909707 RepID=UPI003A85BCD1
MNGAFERIRSELGAVTQAQLSEVLGINQASVSIAKRSGDIPPRWLLTLLRKYRLNPDWIMTGEGPKFSIPADCNETEYQGERQADFHLGF